MLLDADSLERYRQKLDDSVRLTEVAVLLGVTFMRAKNLVDHGILRPISELSVSERDDPRFSRTEVGDLVTRLTDKVPRGRSVLKQSKVILSFEEVLYQCGRLQIDIGPLINLILNDQIRPCSRNQNPGLSCLLFDSKNISDYVRDELQLREGEVLRVNEAAALLDTTVDNLHAIIHRGLLTARRSRMLTFGTLISKKDLDRFRTHYVFVHQLVSGTRTTTKFLTNALIANGIHPISGKAVDGRPPTIFKRSDVEAVDLAKMLRNPSTRAIAGGHLRPRKPLDGKEAAQELGSLKLRFVTWSAAES